MAEGGKIKSMITSHFPKEKAEMIAQDRVVEQVSLQYIFK